jgi:hypothetical protein
MHAALAHCSPVGINYSMLRRLLLSSVLSFLLLSCGESSSRLPGGHYYLVDNDDSHVYLVKREKTSEVDTLVVDQQIVDYRITNGYLLVLRKVAKDYDCYDEKNVPTIITHYSNEDEYWVIDLQKEKEIGPLKEQMYVKTVKELKLPTVKLNAPKDFYPNSDFFRTRSDKCKRMKPE